MGRRWQAYSLVGLALVATIVASLWGSAPLAAQSTFAPGDVFVSVGEGRVQWRTAGGALRTTLDTLAGGQSAGLAFDAAGRLYVANLDANRVSKFSNLGALLGTVGQPESGFNKPESVVVDAAGNVFVGNAGNARLLKFGPNGDLLGSFRLAVERQGVDWIDLGTDQCVLYYTSEGRSIKRYNVCSPRQLTDFATNLPGAESYTLRLLPQGGGVLVANLDRVVLLDMLGNLVRTYQINGASNLFALSLDETATAFWVGDFRLNTAYKVQLSTGNVLTSFTTGAAGNLAGLAVFGARLPVAASATATASPPATATAVPTSTSSPTATATRTAVPTATSVPVVAPLALPPPLPPPAELQGPPLPPLLPANGAPGQSASLAAPAAAGQAAPPPAGATVGSAPGGAGGPPLLLPPPASSAPASGAPASVGQPSGAANGLSISPLGGVPNRLATMSPPGTATRTVGFSGGALLNPGAPAATGAPSSAATPAAVSAAPVLVATPSLVATPLALPAPAPVEATTAEPPPATEPAPVSEAPPIDAERGEVSSDPEVSSDVATGLALP